MKLRHAATLLALTTVLTTAHAKLETWTDLDGRSMEAEFISASDTYVSFRKSDGARYLFPVAKLSETDQSRIRELSGKAPATSTATTTAPETPAAAATRASPGKFTTDISGKLVSLKGKTLSPHNRDALAGAKYYAIYYSAHWCPPCRGFTPELVEAYKTLKARNPDFEIVFVSSDEDADAMKTYMTEYKMAWPAVRLDLAKSLPAVTKYRENGIPNLVFITADGEVLSTSYVDGNYVGPRKVLADIQKKLAGKS